MHFIAIRLQYAHNHCLLRGTNPSTSLRKGFASRPLSNSTAESGVILAILVGCVMRVLVYAGRCMNFKLIRTCFAANQSRNTIQEGRKISADHSPCAAAWRPARREKTTLRVCPVQDG